MGPFPAAVVDASALATNVVQRTLNGGLGNDTLVWNPSNDDDTFEGQAGILATSPL